jgi:hypothetical protein
VLLFVAIIASNAYFLVSWTRSIIPMIINTLRRRLSRRSYQTRPSIPDKMSSVDFSSSRKQSLSNVSVSEVSDRQGRNSRMSDMVPDNSPYIVEGDNSIEEHRGIRVTPFVEG